MEHLLTILNQKMNVDSLLIVVVILTVLQLYALSTEDEKMNMFSKQSDDRQGWVPSTARVGKVDCNDYMKNHYSKCLNTDAVRLSPTFAKKMACYTTIVLSCGHLPRKK